MLKLSDFKAKNKRKNTAVFSSPKKRLKKKGKIEGKENKVHRAALAWNLQKSSSSSTGMELATYGGERTEGKALVHRSGSGFNGA